MSLTLLIMSANHCQSIKAPHRPKARESTAATRTTSRISIKFDQTLLRGAAGGFLSRGHGGSKKSRSNSTGKKKNSAGASLIAGGMIYLSNGSRAQRQEVQLLFLHIFSPL